MLQIRIGLSAFFPDPDPAVYLSAAADSDPVHTKSKVLIIFLLFPEVRRSGPQRLAWRHRGVAQLQASCSIGC